MQVRPKPPTVSQSITHETMQTFVPIACAIALLYCLPFTGAAEAEDISPRPSHSVVANPSNSAPVEPSTKFIGSHRGGPMGLIPAGEFAMGSDRGQEDEQPVHRRSSGMRPPPALTRTNRRSASIGTMRVTIADGWGNDCRQKRSGRLLLAAPRAGSTRGEVRIRPGDMPMQVRPDGADTTP